MAAAERNAQFLACISHIGHDRPGQFGRRVVFWKEHDDEEPQWPCAHNGNIVGIDVNRVAADVIRGEGDGIGSDHEISISGIDNSCVFANLRSDQQAWIKPWRSLQQRSQLLRRKFTDGQKVRRIASHALMIIDGPGVPGQGRNQRCTSHSLPGAVHHVRELIMGGSNEGESKWITARKVIPAFEPDIMIAANDHRNLSLFESGAMPAKYIGVIDIRGEVTTHPSVAPQSCRSNDRVHE
jgi:hypothetical protein